MKFIYEQFREFFETHMPGEYWIAEPWPEITPDLFNKIDIGYSIFNNPHVETVCRKLIHEEFNLDTSREYDVMYNCGIGFPDLITTYHRFLGLEAVAMLDGCKKYLRSFWTEGHNWVPGSRDWQSLFPVLGLQGRLPTEQVADLMVQTKIFVSPLGTGEACFKDYEAMYAGCVVIKPDCSHCETWPETYLNDRTYIPCRWDYSDLQEKVDYVLNNWDSFREMRVSNRDMLLEARTQFALRYANIIQKRFHRYHV